MNFTFDPVKDTANQAKHGVLLALAARLEWGLALVWTDTRQNYGEVRHSALALLGERVFFVAFVDRGEVRRVISLRKANYKGVAIYAANN